MIELEKTYLAKELPKDLENCEHKEIIDVYLPKESEHPVLRLRKNGANYEMTKKEPVKKGDASKQLEQTIVLSKEEFEGLQTVPGKRVVKERYRYPLEGLIAEFDVFKEGLKGLVVVDVEFEKEADKDAFEMPEFCLIDVTQEKFLAGGMLCGRNYQDIAGDLRRVGYDKLDFKKMQSKNRPIGVLDSGLGGLSILKEIVGILPNESIIYFADSKNCPYGEKSLVDIKKITTKVIEFLIKKECKLVVVACNSITSVFIDELRESYEVPFVGVEPATLVAAKETKKGKIGVLVTKTTARSKLFKQTKNKISPRIEVEIEIGKGLVELVEEGRLRNKETRDVILSNLKNFKRKGVDQVVLGCTHYPLLKEIMEEVAPEMNFVDPSLAVAKQVKSILTKESLLSTYKKPACELYFSKRAKGMELLLKTIGLREIKVREGVIF
ncbi:glutamate racemase [bacterium]|jgi:glutamate racemase|nr:glutamate racemase [bacterium]MBT6755743.1 glutamate racemase [Candidatus Paceibacterota bacterium]MBT7038178.1 glutamate racemase [bacterium]MBT7431619.1 glutamate racemase [bacterium]MBT7992309.1 glutamate racemase [bacterium]